MDALLVALLERQDFVGPFLSVVDLFPRLHLFLLEQRDTVREQLGVSLDAAGVSWLSRLTLCGAFSSLRAMRPARSGRLGPGATWRLGLG